MNPRNAGLTLLIAALLCVPSAGQTKRGPKTIHTVAILPFLERGGNTKGMGSQVSDLLFANLVTRPNLILVEREQLNDVIAEQALNVSGLVDPTTRTVIGQLTGAKIIVVGTVLRLNDKTYLVAKIIGTETSRVLGSSVKGRANDELPALVEALSAQVAETIASRSSDLVAKPIKRADRLARLRESLGAARPRIFIAIEERHIGQPTPDPAAQIEFVLVCKELGLEVVDPASGERGDADVVLTGDGFSEFAARHGELTSVKARLEIKAVDRQSRQILHVDRQTTVAADLGENTAAKAAMQDAAMQLAERLLPKITQQE